MTCRHVQQLTEAYLDGELSPSLMAEVHAHLLQCPSCQQRVEMLRVCGEVIANDHSEPALEASFADRVAAVLPNTSQGRSIRLVSRTARRRRFWQMAVSACLPAAAAILFFGILVWPTTEFGDRQTQVKGRAVEATGAGTLVDSTLGVLQGTQQAAEDVGRVLEVSMDEARRNVHQTLDELQKPVFSFMDIFLEPFTGLLDAENRSAVKDGTGDEEEIVRF